MFPLRGLEFCKDLARSNFVFALLELLGEGVKLFQRKSIVHTESMVYELDCFFSSVL